MTHFNEADILSMMAASIYAGGAVTPERSVTSAYKLRKDVLRRSRESMITNGTFDPCKGSVGQQKEYEGH